MSKSTFQILLFLLVSSSLFSQVVLPKGYAEGEKEAMKTYIASALTEYRGDPNPPESPVRTVAEWEELEGVVITWASFQNILAQIVGAIQTELNVYIVCSNAASVRNYLTNQGVDPDLNIFYVEDEYDSIWVRDYGPNSGYLNDVGELVFIDWIYNRPRYRDNRVPDVIGEFMDVPVYSTSQAPYDLVNTGGNFMVDGLGMGFSSDLVLDENGLFNDFGTSNHDEEAVDQIMFDFMGVHEYVKMEALPFDLIHHIDMHMKLVNENTLLVGEYPEGVADGPQIEANIQYVLSNFEAAFGRDFKVERIPMPPSANGNFPDQWNADYRTYANALIANKTIIVPTYEEQYDTTALRIWEEIMPGYNIVGIDCNDIIPLSGALHCITKEIGHRDALQISHVPLDDLLETENDDYKIEAIIRHKTPIQEAKLHYRLKGSEEYQSVIMELTDVDTDMWEAIIPQQAGGATIEYYIEALAESGRTMNKPLVAPDGYFDFEILLLSNQIDIVSNHTVEVFPNPAKEITAIKLLGLANQNINVTLYDQKGRKVLDVFSGKIWRQEDYLFFDAKDFSSGNYVLHIQNEHFEEGIPVIIQH